MRSNSDLEFSRNPTDIETCARAGKSETLELKRSMGQLNAADRTLCAFLNADGGKVVFGVGVDGIVVGQAVWDKTRREIAEAFHWTGAVEIRDRGMNRVIEACEKYGIDARRSRSRAAPPTSRSRHKFSRPPNPPLKQGPSGDQVGTKSSSRSCKGTSFDARADEALREAQPREVPGPSRPAHSGRRPGGDDHSGQAPELPRAVPNDTCGPSRARGGSLRRRREEEAPMSLESLASIIAAGQPA